MGAEAQLADARKKETAALHNFEMLQQSLEDELKFAAKEMAAAKAGIAASNEKKATAEGDLEVTTKDLKEDVEALSDLHQTCLTKAQDYEAETKSRGEELTAIASAKKSPPRNNKWCCRFVIWSEPSLILADGSPWVSDSAIPAWFGEKTASARSYSLDNAHGRRHEVG